MRGVWQSGSLLGNPRKPVKNLAEKKKKKCHLEGGFGKKAEVSRDNIEDGTHLWGRGTAGWGGEKEKQETLMGDKKCFF